MNTLYMRKENEICAVDRSIINLKLKSRGEKKTPFFVQIQLGENIRF